VEEKLGKSAGLKKAKAHGDSDASEEYTSDSEDEDDEGELATETLDVEISATLQAIRSKDPRVYDNNVTFYTKIEEENNAPDDQTKSSKPMYLRDYHRANLLNGGSEVEPVADTSRSFAQEQEDLKKNILEEIKRAEANGEASETSDEADCSDDGFLIAKKPVTKPKDAKARTVPNVDEADKDPETFLSNFMASRAWVPTNNTRFKPLESDDEEEDRRAEEFEQAYNLRFEDPERSNEKLIAHARETASKHSVRREEPNRRKKQRDREATKKDFAKQERDEERARLRKLKVEELELKVKKIKKAAGLRGSEIKEDDWTKFLEDGWDDGKWEKEMAKRFGEDYYAENDYESDAEQETESQGKKKLKKPKWDDDIDIEDLVPGFADDEEDADFSLSDDNDEPELNRTSASRNGSSNSKKKQRAQNENEKKRQARKDRKKIEQMVDQQLDIELPPPSKHQSAFRYRETSPISFGMTANDILMADDTQLNQYAGLKKLAAFRDSERKRKDQKHLGKKARLRQWRKETFGDESGPKETLADFWKSRTNGAPSGHEVKDGAVDIREGGKKRKRSRKSKGQTEASN
jgi:protein KRI1